MSQYFTIQIEMENADGWDAKLETVAIRALDLHEAQERIATIYDLAGMPPIVEMNLVEVTEKAPVGITTY